MGVLWEEGTPPLCSVHWSELGRYYLGCREGASRPVLQTRSSVLPGRGRSLSGAFSVLEGSDEEVVTGRKTSPFTRNYSSPLEPFHLLSVVTSVGLLSLPSHPTEP